MSALPESLPWIPIGHVGDIPELEGRSVTVAGRRVAIFRLPDGWAALDGDWPHRGGPLSDGIVTERCVTCPLHGRRFDLLTGERSAAADPAGATERVLVHEVREDRGRLYLRLVA